MPTYQIGIRRLHLGVRKHGVSLYGWKGQGVGGFTARHPDLQTSTGTIRIRSNAAAAIPDDDFRDLARAVLGPGQGLSVTKTSGRPPLWNAVGGLICRQLERTGVGRSSGAIRPDW